MNSKIRVNESYFIEKGDMNKIIELLWSIYKKHGFMNTAIVVDGSNAGFVNLLKIKWQESLNWQDKTSFGKNVVIRPVNFATTHKQILSHLHTIISKSYLAIEENHKNLITSLRTAYASELSLDKKQTSYSDLLDALRMALIRYNIE